MFGGEAAEQNLGVARLSVITASALGGLKLAAALFTGSLSIVASLVDSVMDLMASAINFFAVKWAGRPADHDHAYGHGKAEGLAGLAQSIFVGVSGIVLLVEGGRRLFEGVGIAHSEIGIVVMAISTLASAWITWKLRSTAKATGSVALAADAVHYASDVWTNLGVLVALVVIWLTGWSWVDGAVAMIVALVVLGTAFYVLRRSTDELMDRGLPPGHRDGLLGAVQADVPELRGMHDLRTRRAGPDVFVDCHVLFDRGLSFVEAHRLSERVRIAIQRIYPGSVVTVHADPDPLLPEDLDEDARSPGGGGDA